jgi:hypothetical protein
LRKSSPNYESGDLELSCPSCKANVIKSYEQSVKLRAKLIKWTGDGCFAVCKSCTNEVEIVPDMLTRISTIFTYEVKKSLD